MPSQPIHQLVYVSRSVLAHVRELVDIVEQSRERNAGCGVTGGLLYTGAYFVQLLEGGREEVEALMLSIERDHRHTAVTTLLRRDRPARDFARWTMAFNEYPGAEGTLALLVGQAAATVQLQQLEALLAIMYQRALLSD